MKSTLNELLVKALSTEKVFGIEFLVTEAAPDLSA